MWHIDGIFPILTTSFLNFQLFFMICDHSVCHRKIVWLKSLQSTCRWMKPCVLQLTMPCQGSRSDADRSVVTPPRWSGFDCHLLMLFVSLMWICEMCLPVQTCMTTLSLSLSLSQYYHIEWVVLWTSSLSSDRYCLLIPSILQDSLTTVVLSVSSWVLAYHTWLTAASVTGFELSSLITFVLKDVDPPISNPCNSLLTVEHIVLISCVDYVIVCHNCIICYCTVSLGLRRWLWYDMIFYTPSNLKRSVP